MTVWRRAGDLVSHVILVTLLALPVSATVCAIACGQVTPSPTAVAAPSCHETAATPDAPAGIPTLASSGSSCDERHRPDAPDLALVRVSRDDDVSEPGLQTAAWNRGFDDVTGAPIGRQRIEPVHSSHSPSISRQIPLRI